MQHFSGELFRQHRREASLTQFTAAIAIGVTPNSVAGYERGRLTPCVAALSRAADAFGVGVGEFFTREYDRAAA